MRKLIKNLILLSVMIGAGTANANFTGIVAGTISGGLKGNAIWSKSDKDLSFRDKVAKGCHAIANSFCDPETYTSQMFAGSLDLSFIGVWNALDWFGIGAMAGVGGTLDKNVNDKFEVLLHEPFNVKAGLAVKFSQVVFNAGVRFGYRTLELKDKMSGTDAKPELTNSWGVGWFHQTMLLIPLPSKEWKVVLSGELYGDVNPMEAKYKSQPVSAGVVGPITDAKLEGWTGGFKLGIGIAYSMFGKA